MASPRFIFRGTTPPECDQSALRESESKRRDTLLFTTAWSELVVSGSLERRSPRDRPRNSHDGEGPELVGPSPSLLAHNPRALSRCQYDRRSRPNVGRD